MAKKTDKSAETSASSTSTVVTPTVRPDDPPPSAASPARPATSGPQGTVGEQVVGPVAELAAASLRATRRLLPGRTAAYLGAGALLVAGVVDLPALVAGGLAYEALRRWDPAPR